MGCVSLYLVHIQPLPSPLLAKLNTYAVSDLERFPIILCGQKVLGLKLLLGTSTYKISCRFFWVEWCEKWTVTKFRDVETCD